MMKNHVFYVIYLDVLKALVTNGTEFNFDDLNSNVRSALDRLEYLKQISVLRSWASVGWIANLTRYSVERSFPVPTPYPS